MMDGLKNLRQRQLLTQKELANASGVGIATICRIEAGKVRPSMRSIRALAKALDVSHDEMRDLLLVRQARLL